MDKQDSAQKASSTDQPVLQALNFDASNQR